MNEKCNNCILERNIKEEIANKIASKIANKGSVFLVWLFQLSLQLVSLYQVSVHLVSVHLFLLISFFTSGFYAFGFCASGSLHLVPKRLFWILHHTSIRRVTAWAFVLLISWPSAMSSSNIWQLLSIQSCGSSVQMRRSPQTGAEFVRL